MKKVTLSFQVDPKLNTAYRKEARRRTKATGERVSKSKVVLETLKKNAPVDPEEQKQAA